MEWIETPAALGSLCQNMEESWAIAVDTESDGFHAYTPRTCLIQVATEERLALVDTLALSEDELEPLWAILEEPEPLKIFHAAQNDILALQRDFDVQLSGIFDTYEANRFLGRKASSLDALLDSYFGLKVSKKYQRFDWKRRPLPEGAMEYAANDVRYLIELASRLTCELEEAGWYDAHYELCQYITAHTAYAESPFDPNDYLSIRGGKKLQPSSQNVLRGLRIWRHELCTRLNRAAFLVIDDRTLVDIAASLPRTRAELEDTRLHSRGLSRYGSEILAIVEQTRDREPPPATRRKRRKRVSLNPEQNATFEALRTWRNELEEKSPLPSDLIATNDVLRTIARKAPRNLDELSRIPGVLDWQVERHGLAILERLQP